MKEFFVFCTMCSLAGPFLAIKPPIIQKPTFQSTNFENILTWKIEEGSPPGTVYQVLYTMYKDANWYNKAKCQNITQLFCNLTHETENIAKCYFAAVRAIVPNCCISNWVYSLVFCPVIHTTIGEPNVKSISGHRSIKFSIQPPHTPLRDKENHILTVVDVLNKVGVDVEYEITLFSQKTEQKWEKTGNDKEFEITDLDPGTEYNGTVHLKYPSITGRLQAFQVQTLGGPFLAIETPIIQEPTFLSTNFENILTWEIEEGSPPGTVYQVRHLMSSDDYWNTKAECQNITQNFCNLTRETDDITELYYAEVRAILPNSSVSNWVSSKIFCPLINTTIGNYIVNYIPGINSIKFSIQSPDTPFRDEENHILTAIDVVNKHGLIVQYEITLFSQKTQQKWEKTGNDKEFEITNLDPGTKYYGTIRLIYPYNYGNSQAFQVHTLLDTRWLPYILGMILLILLILTFLFGTIYYSIYKYIKPHADQKPASLDFKDISRFRPFILNVELRPSTLSKTTPHISEVRPAELCQPVLNILKHQESFSPTEVAYQQQTKMSRIQPPVQHFRQADAPSTGYTPQVIKNSPLCPLEHNPSTLTNGLSLKGASSINKANHMIKLESFISSGPYKAQRPEWANEELQKSETHQKPEEEVESVL